MTPTYKIKLLNDPVYGFITIPNERIFRLIEHAFFQRLRRISQMGLSYLVYPGAQHTRFQHALGCMFLMQKCINVLENKGVKFSKEEKEALLIAILLHDIGHGPFSHALENSLIKGLSHEEISLRFIQKLKKEFKEGLNLAEKILKGEYPRYFFNQLVASQLDMDRLDYLKRDSFYTGVAEGNINSERLIAMLNVYKDRLVVEEKGIYSVEKFLIARRLMYWQVYLHKTGIVAEQLLIRILKRAKHLIKFGKELPASEAFLFFLKNDIAFENFSDYELGVFSRLDDSDIISAMKIWIESDDFVLSNLCRMIINRDLLKIKLKKKPISQEKLSRRRAEFCSTNSLSDEEGSYFVFDGKISNLAYEKSGEAINILYKNGKIKDVTEASDQLNLEALSKPVVKYYICFPKETRKEK